MVGSRKAVRTALVAAAVVSIGACGGGGNPLRVSSSPAAATTASNHALALAETSRLLADVEMPPGSERASSPGSRLLGSPGNGTFVGATDGRRYWRIHESYSTAIAWISAHAPAGSKPGGSTTTQGSRVISTVGGYTYFPPSTAAWANVQLSVEATAIGPDETAVRADAQVQWLDPTPSADTTTGRRLHLDVTGRCPGDIEPYSDVSNTGPGLRQALVPAGTVTSVLVCRYGTTEMTDRPDLRLTLSSRLDHRAVAYLVVKARKVQLSHPTAEPPTGCAAVPTSMVVIVVFGYAGGRSVDVWATPTSCPGNEDNGTVQAPLDGILWGALQLTVPGILATK